MLSVARTGVSDIFREHFSRIPSQVSRTAKSRRPNHKPVGIAMNEKQTPTINLQDWKRKLSGQRACWLHCYTLWYSLELQNTDLALNVIFHVLRAIWFGSQKLRKEVELLTAQTYHMLAWSSILLIRLRKFRCFCNLYYHIYCIWAFPSNNNNL